MQCMAGTRSSLGITSGSQSHLANSEETRFAMQDRVMQSRIVLVDKKRR